MKKNRTRNFVVMFVLGLLAGTGYVAANHPWLCTGSIAYHWASTTVGHGNPVEEKTKGKSIKREAAYISAFNGALNVWSGTTMNLVSGNDLELFYDTYGRRGWLGLATISPSNCVIQGASSKLNATYLDDSSRYSQTAIDHVACQEVGHTFGLDHNRSDNNTCMNDTVLTAGNQINQHDRDQLNLIY